MTSAIENAMLAASDSMILSMTVKATLILAFGLIAVRLAARSRASKRHAILAAAFAALLALPAASSLAPPIRIALPVAPREQFEPDPSVTTTDVAQPVGPRRADAGPAIPRSDQLPLTTLMFGVWLAGAAFVLLPAIIGLWHTRSLRRSGLPWRRGQTIGEELAREAGIHRRIQVLLHESLTGPSTGGVRRPAIVFSPDAQDWNEEDLKRAIIHELEHVRRGDWIWHCLAKAVCCVYWFHPLVWIACRQLTLDAERACDDAVLRRSEPTAYADQLVGLARRMSAARKSPALAMANRSDLSTRVRAVLDIRQQRGRPGTMLVMFACATAAALMAAISPLRIVAAPQAGASPSSRNEQRFEVASVRLEDPRDPRSSPEYTNSPGFRSVTTVFPSNRLTIRHTSLQNLICDAFGVDCRHVLGGPNWLALQRYEVNAKVEGSSRLSREQMRPLLRNLLEDRFHLRTHRGRKIVAGYALVIAKGGPRLQPNKGAPFMGVEGGYTMKWQNVSMEYFARKLENPVRRPVLDRTGIKGMYDFDLKYGPHGPASEDPIFANISESLYANLPDIFSVLEEKLGLKLVPEKIAIDTLVIDHVERVPAAN